MRYASALLSLLLLPALTGCFTIASTITVQPDGSGTLRDEVEVQGPFALAALAAAEDEDEGGFVDKAQLQARAAALGDGVTLMEIEEHEAGYTALYTFSDIGDLRYSTPDLPIGEDGDDETISDDAFDLLFSFSEGSPSTLRITVPESDDAEDGDASETEEVTAEDRENAARGLGMMRALLGDARLAVEVVVEGEIAETDAAFVDGSTVTLIDLSFNDVFDVLEEHPELMTDDAPPTDDLPALLIGREGVAFQPPGEVTVRFE